MEQAKVNIFTDEQLQRDMDYYQAQRISKAMLDSGLIDRQQFGFLTERNRRSFSPFLSEIMPDDR